MAKPIIEIRQAVSADTEKLVDFNIALFANIKELGKKDAECCGIRLYMERENETARQSYLRLGFIETGYEVFENLFPTSD